MDARPSTVGFSVPGLEVREGRKLTLLCLQLPPVKKSGWLKLSCLLGHAAEAEAALQ